MLKTVMAGHASRTCGPYALILPQMRLRTGG
jgi:hypothetical protein